MAKKTKPNFILAIDPGTEQSGWVTYRPFASSDCQINSGIMNNIEIVEWLSELADSSVVVIEMMSCFGMPIGKETMESLVWIGRFIQAAGGAERITRQDIKLHLCNSARAKDANVRQALIDRFGGSKLKAIGLKKTPGPLYGVKSHAWSALAVAVTYSETQGF